MSAIEDSDPPLCPHCGSREDVSRRGSQSHPDKYGFVPLFVCYSCQKKFTGERPDPADVAELNTQDQPAPTDRVGPDECPPCPACGLSDSVQFSGTVNNSDGESVTQYVCVPCDRGFTKDESERAAEVRRS